MLVVAALRDADDHPGAIPGFRPLRRTSPWAIFDSSLRDEDPTAVPWTERKKEPWRLETSWLRRRRLRMPRTSTVSGSVTLYPLRFPSMYARASAVPWAISSNNLLIASPGNRQRNSWPSLPGYSVRRRSNCPFPTSHTPCYRETEDFRAGPPGRHAGGGRLTQRSRFVRISERSVHTGLLSTGPSRGRSAAVSFIYRELVKLAAVHTEECNHF
jgi:hypothetical protein